MCQTTPSTLCNGLKQHILIISQFLGLESKHGLTRVYLCLSLSESYSQVSAEAGSISTHSVVIGSSSWAIGKRGLNSLQAAWSHSPHSVLFHKAFPPRQLASSEPAKESTRKTEVTTCNVITEWQPTTTATFCELQTVTRSSLHSGEWITQGMKTQWQESFGVPFRNLPVTDCLETALFH